MPLNGFICISLAIYVRICACFLSVYLCGCKCDYKPHKNDAQNRVICAILGVFCKESGKLWGKMKKKVGKCLVVSDLFRTFAPSFRDRVIFETLIHGNIATKQFNL